MKNLLAFLAAILCSVGAFGQGAQYRPTPYANGFVQTVTSTGTAQTYLGIGSSTNNALLNGTNVFTGTNTFSAAKFFPANGITYRTLFTTNSIFIPLVTNSTSSPTNDADYRNITALLNLSLPPLCGTNSEVLLIFKWWPTVANPNASGLAAYLGSATNFIWAQNNFATTTNGIATSGAGTSIFKNSRYMTNQVRTTAGSGSPALATWNTFTTNPGYNLTDTSTNWPFRLGVFSANSATATTNMWFEEITIVEKVTN